MPKEKNPTQEYLLQVKLYDAHINNKLEELARLKALATKITSAWRQEAVSGGGSGDRLGDTVVRIADMQNEINTAINAYIDKKKEVKRIIEQVRNPDQLSVLLKCYILHETLEQVACDMGYSYRNVCYIHGRALQAVAEIIAKEDLESFH